MEKETMSFKVSIYCDRCPNKFEGLDGETVKELDKRAKSLGWAKQDEYHFCLDCNLKLKDLSNDDTRLSNLDELKDSLLK